MPDISTMRKEYTTKGLRREELDDLPFKQFEKLLKEALNVYVEKIIFKTYKVPYIIIK